jgi:hypothetical protein
MTLGRWFGPGVIDRYGRVLTVRIFAALALAGLALVVGGSTVPMAWPARRCGGSARRSASRSG